MYGFHEWNHSFSLLLEQNTQLWNENFEFVEITTKLAKLSTNTKILCIPVSISRLRFISFLSFFYIKTISTFNLLLQSIRGIGTSHFFKDPRLGFEETSIFFFKIPFSSFKSLHFFPNQFNQCVWGHYRVIVCKLRLYVSWDRGWKWSGVDSTHANFFWKVDCSLGVHSEILSWVDSTSLNSTPLNSVRNFLEKIEIIIFWGVLWIEMAYGVLYMSRASFDLQKYQK